MESAKETILGRLKEANKPEMPRRITLPPPHEANFTRDQLIEKLESKLTELTAVFYRANGVAGVLEILEEICDREDLHTIMASEDALIRTLDLSTWGNEHDVDVSFPHDFADRTAYKETVFNHADAGITSADFAVAESGTLAIVHDNTNARLLSLAPILHIAVVDINNVVPVYETVIAEVYEQGNIPAHTTFITGPSMTADIQGQMFKGMHGPRKLIVILLEQSIGDK